ECLTNAFHPVDASCVGWTQVLEWATNQHGDPAPRRRIMQTRFNARPQTRRTRRLWLLSYLALGVLLSLFGLSAHPAFALPPDPLDPPVVGGNEPFVLPVDGFEWSVPSRFGPTNNGLVDYHWIEDDFSNNVYT